MPDENHPEPPEGSSVSKGPDRLKLLPVVGVFTRLVHELDASEKASDQVRATLDAISKSIATGIVCWFNETTGELIGAGGHSPLSKEACRAFAQKMVMRKVGAKGAVLWEHLLPLPAGAPRSVQPHTLAIEAP